MNRAIDKPEWVRRLNITAGLVATGVTLIAFTQPLWREYFDEKRAPVEELPVTTRPYEEIETESVRDGTARLDLYSNSFS